MSKTSIGAGLVGLNGRPIALDNDGGDGGATIASIVGDSSTDGVLRITAIAARTAKFRLLGFRPGAKSPEIDITSDRLLLEGETLQVEGPCPPIAGLHWSPPVKGRKDFLLVRADWTGPGGDVCPIIIRAGYI